MTNINNLRTAFAAAAKRQGEVNARINSEWVDAGNPFYRALAFEANEAMGHLNWPWWSGGDAPLIPNEKARLQLFLELADCFAFGLSVYLVEDYIGEGDLVGLLPDRLLRDFAMSETNNLDLLGSLDALIGYASAFKQFNASALFSAARLSGLDASGLLLFHEGKSALNIFRQEHGYKEGKYRKTWWLESGEKAEDNVALAELITQYKGLRGDSAVDGLVSGDFARHIRSNLAITYGASEERYAA